MASGCFVVFDVFLVLLAVFLPPIPVWIKAGLCSADSFINIALCCLGYIPGVLHSWYIIAKYPEVIEIDIERQDILHRNPNAPVYITVNHSPSPPPQHYNVSYGYGTVNPQQGQQPPKRNTEYVPAPPPPGSASHQPIQSPSGPSIPAGPPPEYTELRK